ncbi:MAG: pectin acetylesterase-family hydrolase, partial [Myxococcota bacterium]
VGGAKCRDGSDTGFLLRLGEDASEWLIYLEGGGACFNSVTCLANPNSFGAEDVAATVPGLEFGVFDRRDTVSPVAGWNAVYVPYCTGDVLLDNRVHRFVFVTAGDDQKGAHQRNSASHGMYITTGRPGVKVAPHCVIKLICDATDQFFIRTSEKWVGRCRTQ